MTERKVTEKKVAAKPAAKKTTRRTATKKVASTFMIDAMSVGFKAGDVYQTLKDAAQRRQDQRRGQQISLGIRNCSERRKPSRAKIRRTEGLAIL